MVCYMDTTTYEIWWQLHVRASRGERLDDREQVAYQAGLEQLHDEESLVENTDRLRELRNDVMALDDKCDELQLKRQHLKQRIGNLEKSLSNDTRKALGIED